MIISARTKFCDLLEFLIRYFGLSNGSQAATHNDHLIAVCSQFSFFIIFIWNCWIFCDAFDRARIFYRERRAVIVKPFSIIATYFTFSARIANRYTFNFIFINNLWWGLWEPMFGLWLTPVDFCFIIEILFMTQQVNRTLLAKYSKLS